MIGYLLTHRWIRRGLIPLTLVLFLGKLGQPATHALPLTLVHTTTTDFLAGTSDGNVIVTEERGGALELARQPTDQGVWTDLLADLPISPRYHTAVLVNNHLFVMSGTTGGFRNPSIFRSTVDASGNLGPWRLMPRLPSPYIPGYLNFGAGGYLFIEGVDPWGAPEPAEPALFSSQVDDQGNLGPWQSLGVLPNFNYDVLWGLRNRAAVAGDGYVFILANHDIDEETRPAAYSAPVHADGTLGEWTPVIPLPEALERFAVVAYNHHLIVSGGRTAWQPNTGDRIPRNTIYRAPIHEDGTLGEWSVWGTLPKPLDGHAMTIANGHLIITADDLDLSPTKIFAAELIDGNVLGPWQRLSDTPVSAYVGPQLTTARGHVILTGGHEGTAAYRLALGATQRIGQWSYYGSARSVRSTDHPLQSGTASDGYLFILGAPGETETPVYSHHVEAATPEDLTWVPQPPLPGAVDGQLLVSHGAVYFAGNTTDDDAGARVYRAPITAPGTLGTWEPLPAPTSQWRPVRLDVMGDRLLVSACIGFDESIYTLTIDDTGPAGPWVLAGQTPGIVSPPPFPTFGCGGTLAVTGERITYVTGDLVYQAALAADGILEEWQLMNSPFQRFLDVGAGATVANGLFFVLGGFKNLGTFVAPVLTNGLGDWATEAPLPESTWGRYESHAVAVGRSLFNLSAKNNDLYRAPLSGSARHGSFTGQFDLGAEFVMNRLAWVVEGSAGTVRMRYRIAGEDGIFGAWSAFTTTNPISLPGDAVGRYLEYQPDFDNPTDDYLAVTEVSLLRGVGFVTVQDEAGQPVEGAILFHNGELLTDADGEPLRTGADGRLSVEALQVSDTLATMALQLEKPTDKDAHDGWAYRIYQTSLVVQPDGQMTQYVVIAPGEQILTLRRDQPLVLFNIVVSVEWNAYTFADANPDVPFDTYLKQLARAFRSASNTLYDVTDGQFAFGSVTIYDDGRHWGDADFQVLVSNQVRPRTAVGGITAGPGPYRYNSPNGSVNFYPGQIRLGRFWQRTSGAAGAWDQPDGFRTIAHEFAHYALYLYDEYYYLDSNARLRPAHCTSPAIRTNRSVETNASLMDWHYNATELAMAGTSQWTDACRDTAQWRVYGESDWETVVGNYDDVEQPARWAFRTPASHGGNPGPDFIPLNLPSIQVKAENTAPANNPVLEVLDAGGALLPTQRVRLYLLKQTGSRPTRVLDQGTTNFLGQLEVRGADSDDRLVAITWDGAQQGSKLLNTSDPLHLSPSRWTPTLDARPRADDSGLNITVSNVLTLGGSLSVSLFSGGRVISSTLSPAGDGSYVGALPFDPAQPIREGHLILQATDGEGVRLETIASFAIGGVGPIHADQHPPIHPASGDGNLQLIVPGGHAPEGTQALVLASRGLPAPLPAGFVLVGGPYTVRATAALSGPAALAMYYQEEVIAAWPGLRERDIRIYHWSESEERWQDLGGTLDPEINLVSTVVDELGVYLAVAGPRPTFRSSLPLITR